MLSKKLKNTQWYFNKKTNLMDLANKEEYQDLLESIEELKSKVIQSYVGASLANLFIDHPEIESITVTADSQSEYNDEGGSYEYYTAHIEFEFNQDVDADEFDQIASEFNEEGDGYEYFKALDGLNQASYDAKGTLDRSDIKHLLEENKVSGLDVFKFIY